MGWIVGKLAILRNATNSYGPMTHGNMWYRSLRCKDTKKRLVIPFITTFRDVFKTLLVTLSSALGSMSTCSSSFASTHVNLLAKHSRYTHPLQFFILYRELHYICLGTSVNASCCAFLECV